MKKHTATIAAAFTNATEGKGKGRAYDSIITGAANRLSSTIPESLGGH